MNFVFFDATPWDYDVGTPYERPIGGSQSALCYLAAALAARGHSVTTYTGVTKPRVFQGVQCRSFLAFTADTLRACDALIALNGPAKKSVDLRRQIRDRCRLILWTQHSFDQPANFALDQPDARAGWDKIVCVSQWHATTMQQRYNLDPTRIAILQNAIGPAFANLFSDAAALAAAKSSSPLLAYTSTPYRGLEVLAWIFPELHRLDQRLRLRVYSSMKVCGRDEAQDRFADLYAICRSTPGIEYFGSVPQPVLAEALKSALILAYPNTYAETSCIAVMEAMAAGLLVVTTDLGALPETTMGLGALVPGVPSLTREALVAFAQSYALRLVQTMQAIDANPLQYWSTRWEQVQAMNAHYTWPVRAAQWEQLVEAM